MTMLSLFILIYGDRLPAEVESNSEPFGRCPRQRYQDLVSLGPKKYEGLGVILWWRPKYCGGRLMRRYWVVLQTNSGLWSKQYWCKGQTNSGMRGKPIWDCCREYCPLFSVLRHRTPSSPTYLSEVLHKSFALSHVFLLFSGGKSVLLVKEKVPSRSGFPPSMYVALKTRHVNPNIHVRRY